MPTSAVPSRLKLILTLPRFQAELADLAVGVTERVVKLLNAKKKIVEQLSTWQDAIKHKGLNPHKVRGKKTPGGDDLWSIKLARKERMLVYVQGQEVVAWSVHPDHDSAYQR